MQKHRYLLPDWLLVFTDKRMPKVLLIGAISGLPWALIGSVLTLWLKDAGYSRSQIGLLGYIFIAYALNFLWAPLLDNCTLPWLGKYAGRRKSWIFFMQGIMLVSVVILFFCKLPEHIGLVTVTALVIAFASSTQDVAIDALRIEIVGEQEHKTMAMAAAMATIGWYAGYNLGGSIALYFGNFLKSVQSEHPWQSVYLLMTVGIVLCNIGLLSIYEKTDYKTAGDPAAVRFRKRADGLWQEPYGFIYQTFFLPFKEFFIRNGWKLATAIICFIFLFKVGEAFLGRMSLLFYREVGFNEAQIATYSKLLGWGIIAIFAVVGSLISIRFGTIKSLIICGLAMAASNLLFSWLALVGPNTAVFAVAAGVDQITTAISTVAFVTFISLLCNRAYTAAQYALLASIGNLSRTSLSAHSGQLVDWLGGNWSLFFLLTAFMVLPSLLVLLLFRKRIMRMLSVSGT